MLFTSLNQNHGSSESPNLFNQEEKIKDLQMQLEKAQTQLIDLQKELNDVFESTSWKITFPLRYISELRKNFLKQIIKKLAIYQIIKTSDFNKKEQEDIYILQNKKIKRYEKAIREKIENTGIKKKI